MASQQAFVAPTGRFTDHASIPLLQKLNADLVERLDATVVEAQLEANLQRLHNLVDEITGKLDSQTVSNFEFAC